MAKKFFWLTYDLGVQGDYDGMYAWLDDQDAKECGDSVACFYFEYDKDFLAELKESISESVTLDRKSRVYVVYLRNGKMKGKFIVGKRKSPPWDGYGSRWEEEEDEFDG